MLAVTCILTFADGQRVIGTIQANDPDSECPVSYQGAIHRLPISARLQSMQVSTFVWLFNFVARESGAELKMRRIGAFESSNVET